MSAERLVSMANQIARFFEGQPGENPAELTANHLKSFWDPRMRAGLLQHVQAGGEGLTPIAASAVTLLDRHKTPQAAGDLSIGPGDDVH